MLFVGYVGHAGAIANIAYMWRQAPASVHSVGYVGMLAMLFKSLYPSWEY